MTIWDNYTKSELVEAIKYISTTLYGYRDLPKNIISAITNIRRQKVFDNASKAAEKAIADMNAYMKWQKEVINKYGDGKTVKFSALPFAEMEKGARLQTAWNRSEEARKKARLEEDKMYKEWK